MDKQETLFFTGHREFYKDRGTESFEALVSLVESYAEKGYKNFISGGAVGFDTMAAECVLALKEKGFDLTLVLMLPCADQDRLWREDQKRKYRDILKRADKVVYVSMDSYTDGCMLARDRAMADASSACIAYCTRGKGGTAYTVRYALKADIPVTNFALMN